jgi:hypothetical protein
MSLISIALSNRRIQALVLAFSLVPALVAFLATDAGAADAEQPIDLTRTAYFTNSASNALPPTLTSEVPPGSVCLVAGIANIPQVCGEQMQQLKTALSDTPLSLDDGAPVPQTTDDRLPQAVPPDSLPIGMLSGNPRYYSALEFSVPVIAVDEEFSRFELVLHENPSGGNVAFESPAFRQAVLAAFVQVRNQSPQPFIDLFNAIVSQDVPLVNPAPTGIEACPIVERWEGQRDQSADVLPEIDCIFGSTGQFDEETDTWTFDLTFAVQAWESGDLDANGILLRPVGAENLAYGDPDLSTNYMLNLSSAKEGDGQPIARFSTIPALDSLDPLTPLGGGGFSSGGLVDSTNAFVSPQTGSFGAGGSESAAPPAASSTGTGELEAAQPISTDRGVAWYAWLMLPFGLAIAFFYHGALGGVPAATAAGGGAMTRLMEKHGG